MNKRVICSGCEHMRRGLHSSPVCIVGPQYRRDYTEGFRIYSLQKCSQKNSRGLCADYVEKTGRNGMEVDFGGLGDVPRAKAEKREQQRWATPLTKEDMGV